MLAYTRFSGDETLDALMGVFLFASFAFGVVAVTRMYRPPRKAKPRWLAEEEERRRARSG